MSDTSFDDICKLAGVDPDKMRQFMREKEEQKKREAQAKPKEPALYMQVLAEATAAWATEMQRRRDETDELLRDDAEKRDKSKE